PSAFAAVRICGDKICDANNGDDAEAEREQMRHQIRNPPSTPEEAPVEEEMPVPDTTTPEMEVIPEEKMEEKMEKKADHGWKTTTGTITSMVDPGVGHETHQLAIILPPTDKVYKGILSYSASEPIQLVALHGPLAEGEDAGQAIWTPDGTTKFALTFIDPETSMGSWMFTGNALAVHTLNTDQFTVSYSVSYMEKEMSDTVKTGTITSMVDPGKGHETHQLAIILPPSDKAYSGILTYSASEPIQLVALHGPLAEGEDAGQAIWTPDGTTKFALTFVDSKAAAGTWKFAGNALAVHTLNTEPFTVSYSVVAGQ
ncbi:MAG TPA: hypothetical protein VD689_03570, partial [Nitrosopumilaceae archaeon]|nr:hypothetical protein [Nitrosopumilaceae archaeon]